MFINGLFQFSEGVQHFTGGGGGSIIFQGMGVQLFPGRGLNANLYRNP